MGNKKELGKIWLFDGNKPLLPVNVDTTPLVDNFEPHNEFEERGWAKNFNASISFDVEMTAEMEKIRNELFDSFSRCYEQYLKDVEDAITKILTEYIDDPFTTDWRKATKEEFEKRQIKALVYQEMIDGTLAFLGVQQGTTLVCVNGMKIENFDCRK